MCAGTSTGKFGPIIGTTGQVFPKTGQTFLNSVNLFGGLLRLELNGVYSAGESRRIDLVFKHVDAYFAGFKVRCIRACPSARALLGPVPANAKQQRCGNVDQAALVLRQATVALSTHVGITCQHLLQSLPIPCPLGTFFKPPGALHTLVRKASQVLFQTAGTMYASAHKLQAS